MCPRLAGLYGRRRARAGGAASSSGCKEQEEAQEAMGHPQRKNPARVQ